MKTGCETDGPLYSTNIEENCIFPLSLTWTACRCAWPGAACRPPPTAPARWTPWGRPSCSGRTYQPYSGEDIKFVDNNWRAPIAQTNRTNKLLVSVEVDTSGILKIFFILTNWTEAEVVFPSILQTAFIPSFYSHKYCWHPAKSPPTKVSFLLRARYLNSQMSILSFDSRELCENWNFYKWIEYILTHRLIPCTSNEWLQMSDYQLLSPIFSFLIIKTSTRFNKYLLEEQKITHR